MEFSAKPDGRHNFSADLTYAQHLKSLNKIADCIQHLQLMLRKYNYDVNYKQKILLNIAILSYKENDLEKALTYFLVAFQLDKNSQLLQVRILS